MNAVLGLLVLAFLSGLLNAVFTMGQTAVSALGPFAVEQIEEGETRIDRFLRSKLIRLHRLEARFSLAGLLMLISHCFVMTKLGIALTPDIPALGATLGIITAIIIHITMVEVYARSLALSAPLDSTRRIVPVAWLLAWPLTPVLALAEWLLPLPKPGKTGIALSDMHLRLLPSLGGVERVMHEETFELIDSVRDFGEMNAEDIMTPRTEVDGVPDSMKPAEIYEKLRSTPFSRLLVFGESLDDLKGVLLAKETLLQRPEDPLSLLRPVPFAPEKERLFKLLATIRKQRTHLVVIQDEYGGTAGIVTLHDLFETIVGHIDDVEDEEELWIQERANGSFLLNGRVEIWEINDDLGMELEEEIARTIGGLVFNTLGRVADVGDVVERDGVRLKVESVLGNRIETLSMEILTSAPIEENPSS